MKLLQLIGLLSISIALVDAEKVRRNMCLIEVFCGR